jgi:hypothetical protein
MGEEFFGEEIWRLIIKSYHRRVRREASGKSSQNYIRDYPAIDLHYYAQTHKKREEEETTPFW